MLEIPDLNCSTVGILQYKPIQSAKYCNLICQLRATELDYIVKCPQCLLLPYRFPHVPFPDERGQTIQSHPTDRGHVRLSEQWTHV